MFRVSLEHTEATSEHCTAEHVGGIDAVAPKLHAW